MIDLTHIAIGPRKIVFKKTREEAESLLVEGATIRKAKTTWREGYVIEKNGEILRHDNSFAVVDEFPGK